MAKISMVSLGCPKNTVDSEEILGEISNSGHIIINDPADADVLIINTCGFIKSAKEESISAILNALQYKDEKCKSVIVTGCLVQRYGKELADEIPEVDAFIGLGRASEISAIIDSSLNGLKITNVEKKDAWWKHKYSRLISTNHWTSYLRIADGCDNRCSYCAIPDIRGSFASRDKSHILDEVKFLADNGVKELNIVAQDITRYGNDIAGKYELSDLLHNISDIAGINWMRLIYCYPTRITDDLIDEIVSNHKICKYIDIPLQHSSDRILKLMNRSGNRNDYLELLYKLRNKCPEIAIRTSFIVGFPSENDDDFDDLIDFVKIVKFDRAGVFKYSPEDGTPAAGMKQRIPAKTVNERYKKLMTVQQMISLEKNLSLVGKRINVLVEKTGNKAIGRSYRDAPEIDGLVYLKKIDSNIKAGDFITVEIIDARHYDLIGKQI